MLKEGIDVSLVIFETSSVKPQFDVGPFNEHEENIFEKKQFSKQVSLELTHPKIIYIDNVNDPESHDAILKNKIDVAVVFGTGLIKPPLIKLFGDNIINVHRGIAEEYRGLDSDLWALYHEDYKNVGVTIHKVITELDKGEITHQEFLNLENVDEIFHIRYHTTLLAYDLVVKTLEEISKNTISFVPQKKFGRYYSFMPLALKKIAENKFKKFKA